MPFRVRLISLARKNERHRTSLRRIDAAGKTSLMTLPNSKSVFVVDDDPSMLRGVERLLKVHGFRTELFESAEEVCSRANMDDAFCVVLDINLNGKSGIEL